MRDRDASGTDANGVVGRGRIPDRILDSIPVCLRVEFGFGLGDSSRSDMLQPPGVQVCSTAFCLRPFTLG